MCPAYGTSVCDKDSGRTGFTQGSLPDTNSTDIALKYSSYFGTISAKIKPTDAVKWLEGLCQQLSIQNNERLKLNITMKS